MYFSKIALVCLVVVGSGVNARPQVTDYSDITDENDPRFMFDSNPTYNFKYQVSDETEQTYMAHEEAREGPAVTGQYSYVDPLGSLIIVKYIADDNGYQETREVQENFVTIRVKPKKQVTVVAPAPRPAPRPVRPAPRPAPRPSTDSNLVANIIAQLTPFIKQTVTDSLGARTTTTRRVVQTVPVQAVPATRVVTDTSSLFGESGENRITVETPHFDFDHFLDRHA